MSQSKQKILFTLPVYVGVIVLAAAGLVGYLLRGSGTPKPQQKKAVAVAAAQAPAAPDPHFNPFFSTNDKVRKYEAAVMAQPGGATMEQLMNVLRGYEPSEQDKSSSADFYRVADIVMKRADADSISFFIVARAARAESDLEFGKKKLEETFAATVAYMKKRGMDPSARYNATHLAALTGPDPVMSYNEVGILETVATLAVELGKEDAADWRRQYADALVTERAQCTSCGQSYDDAEKAYAIYERLGDANGMRIAALRAGSLYLDQYVYPYQDVRFKEADLRKVHDWYGKGGYPRGKVDVTVRARLDAELRHATENKVTWWADMIRAAIEQGPTKTSTT